MIKDRILLEKQNVLFKDNILMSSCDIDGLNVLSEYHIQDELTRNPLWNPLSFTFDLMGSI